MLLCDHNHHLQGEGVVLFLLQSGINHLHDTVEYRFRVQEILVRVLIQLDFKQRVLVVDLVVRSVQLEDLRDM